MIYDRDYEYMQVTYSLLRFGDQKNNDKFGL